MNEINENSLKSDLQNAEQTNANPSENKNGKEKEKLTGWPRVIKEIREWVVSLAVAIVAVFIISNYLFLPIKVDGDSMNPTLTNKERLLVTVYDVKLSNKLQKGDVVICNYYGRTNKDPILGLVTMDTNFVKRIVGVEGDTVSRVRGVTYINGEPLNPRDETSYSYTLKEIREIVTETGETEKRYVVTLTAPTGATRENELTYKQLRGIELDYEYVLGEKEYFVVGDNRYNSHDSRAWNGPDVERYIVNNVTGQVGPITEDMIVGRAKFVFWPLGEIRKVENNPYYAYPGDPVPTGIAADNGGINENN